jgi:hypothetical protein
VYIARAAARAIRQLPSPGAGKHPFPVPSWLNSSELRLIARLGAADVAGRGQEREKRADPVPVLSGVPEQTVLVDNVYGSAPGAGAGEIAQRTRALEEGREMLLAVSDAVIVRRVFALTGIDRMIPTFPSLEEALWDAAADGCQPPVGS